MQHLVKQRKALLTRLVAGGNFVKGSITCVCGTCGRSRCICKTKAGTKAYRLTYKDSGQKTQIVYIPRNRLSEMKRLTANYARARSLILESGVNFSVSLQIWPKTGICTQNVCSSRSIFRNAARATSALQRS